MSRCWIETEYGIPATVAGSRAWERISSAHVRRLETAAQYVGMCRRLARQCFPPEAGGPPWLEGAWRVDGRLVAVGFNHVPPSEWIRGERRDGREPRTLADFVAWWDATQERPDKVGSTYNASPETAFTLWSAGPSVRRIARLIPTFLWESIVRTDGRLRRRWLRHALPIGRALRRSTGTSAHISAQALRRLGELTADMQAVALYGAFERADRGIIRLRHLDWAGVRRAVQALDHDVSGRIAAALAYRAPRGRGGRLPNRFVDFAGPLCPAYPRVTGERAARLCLGASPVEVSGGILTRREAHDWLTHESRITPVEYLTRRLPGELILRSAAVARWMLDVWRRGGWTQLTRVREVHGPAGRVVQARLLDKIDEIQDVDLVEGVRTNVVTAFERAGQRWALAHRAVDPECDDELAPTPEWARALPQGVRVLTTPRQLAEEGRELQHCIAGYGPAVAAGHSIILSLSVGGQRSTAELSPQGRVFQHRGFCNGEPPPDHQAIVRLLARRAS